MDERLFARLAARLLQDEAVVLASVRATRGATPRKRGSRMLVCTDATEFSVGGGAAEAHVIDAARALLVTQTAARELVIDLSGRPGAAGVCGGSMRIALRRWHGDADARRARAIAAALVRGETMLLDASDLGVECDDGDVARPDPRLLIVGAGHCGIALHDLARHLDYDRWVFDPRVEALDPALFPGATRDGGDFARVARALDTGREVHAVLLNRDFGADVATLRALAPRPLAFLGMMGSAKRIAQVRAALPDLADWLAPLRAPVGLELGAHTPHEIAVSILAQLVQHRATLPRG